MTLEQIAEKLNGIDNKIDLIIGPVKEDVTDVKTKVGNHGDRIIELEEFKKGHQQHHQEELQRRRFNWEIIAGSGIIGAIMIWLTRPWGGA